MNKYSKTKFRPCIDLHEGKVKQIVGSTLGLDSSSNKINVNEVKVNFVSNKNASWYSNLYFKDKLLGGHIIRLGPNNDEESKNALKSYPNGLQIGGGINLDNSEYWLEEGASHVIITSSLFNIKNNIGYFDEKILDKFVKRLGSKKIVIDLSCQKHEGNWIVMMNKWKTPTNLKIDKQTIINISGYCDEFLIHSFDFEGKSQGMDLDLIKLLSSFREFNSSRITYAGGANSIEDLDSIDKLSKGSIDLTIGSALDIFGGNLIKYSDCVNYNNLN